MKSQEVSQAPEADAAPDEKKKNLGSRAAFAATFAFVGTKLSWIATAVDARNLLKEEPTLGGKIKAIFNGTLKNKILEQVKQDAQKTFVRYPEMKGIEKLPTYIKSGAKAFKYTAITAVIGAVAGATIGWVRGSRVEHPKDIIHHPIQSLKLVLGPKPKPSQQAQAPMVAKSDTPPAETAGDDARWQDRVAQPQPVALAVNR